MTIHRNDASNHGRTSTNKIALKTALFLCCLSGSITDGFTPPSVLHPPRSSYSSSVPSPREVPLESSWMGGGTRESLRVNRSSRCVENSRPKLFSGKDEDESPRSVTASESESLSSSVSDGRWNPSARRTVLALSSLGALETGYLTYLRLFGGATPLFCPGASDGPSACASVLNGPYATLTLPGAGPLPLAALGCAAYTTVATLSLLPLLRNDRGTDDSANRAAILCATTTTAAFSSFLLSLLFYVLHADCPYCYASAALSLAAAATAWSTGCLPHRTDGSTRGLGVGIGAGSVAAATAAALVLFLGGGGTLPDAWAAVGTNAGDSSVVVSGPTAVVERRSVPPPPITATSTPQAMGIARDLVSLDAKMYGAYWCSHCNDQKQTLGREAMRLVTYVECAEDGKDSQRDLCKARNVPGFPTWDIGGKLYPGEWALDELEEIVGKAMKKAGK